MSEPRLLDSRTMARFAANGYLMMESVVPDDINARFLNWIGEADHNDVESVWHYLGGLMASSTIPVIRPGTPLSEAYPPGSPIDDLLKVPRVAGAIQSLVGSAPVFDHHFLHPTIPDQDNRHVSQPYHQDSTIDPRKAFDIQLMYFPHEVTPEMGGTRYLPGSHLRVVSEMAIGRYQNVLGQKQVVCPAGSILIVHMGIWHGAMVNRSDRARYMFKIRVCPTERQSRLWDDSDLGNDHFEQRPIFWTDPSNKGNEVHAELMKPQPWFEADTGRLEFMNRIRFWRYLLGDDSFDADYWLTRVENEFE